MMILPYYRFFLRGKHLWADIWNFPRYDWVKKPVVEKYLLYKICTQPMLRRAILPQEKPGRRMVEGTEEELAETRHFMF